MADVESRCRRTSSTGGWRRSSGLVALLLAALVGIAGCTSEPDASAGKTSTATPDGSAAGFGTFSGMHVPAAATNVQIEASTDDSGYPSYLVAFDLPTDEVDQFCRDGKMSRPLRVITIPDSTREQFDYQGDSSSGIRIASASLPSDVRIQRDLFATGTHTSVAHVQVHAYAIGR